MGLDPAGVEVLATFPDLFLAPSQHAVTPVLAWWPSPVPVGVVDRGEVERVLRVPVADLVDPANRFTAVFGPYRGPGVRGGRPVRVGLHRDAAQQPVRARRAGRALGRRAGAPAARPGHVAVDAGDAASERVGRPRPDPPAASWAPTRGAGGGRASCRPCSAWSGWSAARSSPCGSCPGCSRTTPASTGTTPAGVLALLAAVVAFALLGQGLMLLLARRCPRRGAPHPRPAPSTPPSACSRCSSPRCSWCGSSPGR